MEAIDVSHAHSNDQIILNAYAQEAISRCLASIAIDSPAYTVEMRNGTMFTDDDYIVESSTPNAVLIVHNLIRNRVILPNGI